MAIALVNPVLLQPLGGFVMLSTASTAETCIILCLLPLAFAQEVTLTMKPKETQHGTRIHVELLLDARSNPAPAALQWEFKIPPGLQLEEIEPGKAVKKAGKTLVCNGAKCLVYAGNRTTIPNRQIALAKIRMARSLDAANGVAQVGSQVRNRKQELQIVDLVAASLDGKVIKVVSGSGAPRASKIP
jgi:hypothetical protein